MASLDIKDAYYSVAVAKHDRKFLRFLWKGVRYQYTCLPNGLSSCPRAFTKLLKPPLARLRKLGHIIASYIDDLFLQGKTFHQCVANVIAALRQFDELGFIIHPGKSTLLPSQRIVLLGFVINSVDMSINLTEEKREALHKLCTSLLGKPTVTIRALAQTIGSLIATFPGVMHGPLYYRALEGDKTLALRHCKGNFDHHMKLSPPAREELEWWVKNIPTASNVISHGQPNYTLTTDASHTGWGAVFQDKTTGGPWSVHESQHHINYLEMLALILGLKTYCNALRQTHIRVRLDNTTTIAVINHMGTSHSDDCNILGREIWEWCIKRNIWISAAHIPGIANTEADYESRNSSFNTEWSLNDAYLTQALSQFDFIPSVDIFASRLNAKFPSYVSFRPDPGAIAIDAFAQDLANLKFYAFPPFSVIIALLQKIREDKAVGVCVLPDWPTQAWYP